MVAKSLDVCVREILIMKDIKGKIIKCVKRVIKVICVLVIIMIFFLKSVEGYLILKWTTPDENRVGTNIRGFQDEKEDSIDIVFIGNSSVYRGVVPMNMYERSGFTSYSFCAPAQRTPMAYYYMKQVLQTQRPKAIFLNVDPTFQLSKPNISCTCKSILTLPNGDVKKQVLMDNNIFGGLRARYSVLFPSIKYRYRRDELIQEDFELAYGHPNVKVHSDCKGYDPSYAIVGSKNKDYMKKDLDIQDEIPEESIMYLEKMIDLCKKNDTDLIFMQIPTTIAWNQKRHDAMQKFTDEKNIEFIDFCTLNDEIKIDWDKDTADGGNHLNHYGACKVTDYLEEYINKHYKLEDHRQDSEYSKWNDDISEFKVTLSIQKDEDNNLEKK